jgi:hypothetical protein
MADVNEEIVEQYLKIVKQWFYVANIQFKVPSNFSNIDLLAYNPNENKYYDIEVKYRSKYVLAEKNKIGNNISKKSIQEFLKQFFEYNKERNKKINEYANAANHEKILITTKKIFGSKEKRERMEKALINLMKKKKYKIDIWYFDNIIPELVKHVNLNGKYETQLLQAIRMIKTYMDVKEKNDSE